MSKPATKKVESQPTQAYTYQEQVRIEHSGKWLAWSLDGKQLLAVGDTHGEMRSASHRAGHVRFISDWVPPADSRQTTGLE